jgi:hypothetical protein
MAATLPTYQPSVLLAPIATIRSGAALTAMPRHISAAMAEKTALPRQRVMAVPNVWTARFALYISSAAGPVMGNALDFCLALRRLSRATVEIS